MAEATKSDVVIALLSQSGAEVSVSNNTVFMLLCLDAGELILILSAGEASPVQASHRCCLGKCNLSVSVLGRCPS